MIRIALQTKGRLNEESIALLREIGINVSSRKRELLSKCDNFPVEILYLRDDDIPQAVSRGVADIGIVGLNEVCEKSQYPIDIIYELGFSRCRLSLAIPKGDEYNGVEYFNNKRVATSYPVILADYFARQGVNAEIEEIAGSVEIAPAIDMADAIFDIVSSGGTLVTNGLKEVEKVLECQAVLVASKNLEPQKQAILDQMIFRIESLMRSKGKKYLLINIPNSKIDEALALLPGMKSPTLLPLANKEWSSLHAVVDQTQLWDTIEKLKAIGAEDILVLSLEKMIL